MNALKQVLIGMVLGVANVIPGVSAGTMAVIMNIYDDLLEAISLDKQKLKRNFTFLVTIGIGAVVGILVFSNTLEYLYEHFNKPTSFFFIGVIIGSIPMIWRNASKGDPLTITKSIPFVVTLVVMAVMAVGTQSDTAQKALTNLDMMQTLWIMFAAAISAFAMIIPGISGSFIMLTLGVYTTTITAISDFNIAILIPVGVGVLIGLVIGTQIVKVLLSRFRQGTYLAILGLVVGSIFTLYPGLTMNKEGIISLIIMGIGMVISYAFSDK
ncbi:MAG: DUF368 domain-containing protein [Cellulosilyticaceae bacterium]